MTYSQLRRFLTEVARYGDAGAPHVLLPVARWLDLRNGGVVVQDGDRWRITERGWRVLEEPSMPRERPVDRPVQRTKARRTPAIGRAPIHQTRKAG